MFTDNNFVDVNKIEFSIFYNNINNLYIISIYRSPDSNVSPICQNLVSFLESLPMNNAAQEPLKSIFESFGTAMHVDSPISISNTSTSMILSLLDGSQSMKPY